MLPVRWPGTAAGGGGGDRHHRALDDPRSHGGRGSARVAAIEFPFGRPLGQPHDAVTQRAVLRATLDALRDAEAPGAVVHLPFEWPESPAEVHWHPKQPSPILQLLAREPSLFQRLVAGDIPPEASRRNQERTPS